MAHSMLFLLASFAATALAQNQAEECFADDYVNPCQGFAVDFHDGGSYFQNISSPDDFTFAGQFAGCEADGFANNVLIDPNGDNYLCSDTDLHPDDITQTSTCPIEKNEMWSGDWSVLILSNNGEDGCPIALQRDFELTVAEPSTYIYTPTVTLPETVTPIFNYTSVTTSTSSTTETSTVTSAKYTLKPTTTIKPKRVTVTKTRTIATISKTAYTIVPVVSTRTITKTCSIPRRATQKDKKATITPTIISAAALQPAAATVAARRMRRVPLDNEGKLAHRDAFIAKRRAWLEENAALEKRAPDLPTTTVTEVDTSLWSTTTSTSYAPTSTITVISETVTTLTIKTTETVLSGKTTLSQVTVTAPTPTKTKTKYTVKTTTVRTVTFKPTITVTVRDAPATASASCTSKGGKMVR